MRCPYCGDRRTEVLNGVPWPQLLSPPEMPLLRVTLQYPREASKLEPCGKESGEPRAISEGVQETADAALNGIAK